jgi:NADH:ubiquinone oxidoreductase subunit 2 (subunit N)
MRAYSSIAHGGYLLVALLAGMKTSAGAVDRQPAKRHRSSTGATEPT